MLKVLCFVAICVLAVWMLIFQLLVPWLMGLPFFPVFRAKQIRKLESEIAEVTQEIEANKYRDVLATMKPQANNTITDSNGDNK